jgi:hypothetical protein
MIDVIENFFDDDYCNYVYEYAKNNFTPESRHATNWKIKKNTNIEFENKIKSKISHLIDFNSYRVNKLFLTEYEIDESLTTHLDNGSVDNLIIQLTSGFTGGEFIIEEKLFNLNKGDCVRFNGAKLKHGLRPIKSGTRAALNIWISPIGKKII